MVEQRYQSMLAVIADGLGVTVAAAKVGVTRQTLHSWLSRHEAERPRHRSKRQRTDPVIRPDAGRATPFPGR